MSEHAQARELAERLRRYATGLEREAESLEAQGRDPTSLPAVSQKHETIQAWGTRVGAVLDQAFDSGVLHWEHYAALKADEAKWKRDAADWHYRLFLATAGDIAASEAETGRVLIPGFLSSRRPSKSLGRRLENGDCAHALGEAIREVANLVDTSSQPADSASAPRGPAESREQRGGLPPGPAGEV